MPETLFSNEELRMMEQRNIDRLIKCIESGEYEEAKTLARKMHNESQAMHDLYRDWISATLSAIGKRYGDGVLESIMFEGVHAWWEPISKKLHGDHGLPKRIRMFIAGLRGHLQPLNIQEDDEKITIQMRPCGSGGRLILEGKYEGPNALLTIEDPQQMTYDRPNFPVYCAHESAMEKVDITSNGHPFVVVEPAEALGKDHCSFIIYKDPENIPSKYYKRVGFKKNGG